MFERDVPIFCTRKDELVYVRGGVADYGETEALSTNENGAVLLRIRLSSTLHRRKRSPKTEPFQNALQSGAI